MEKLQYIQTIQDTGEELEHYIDQDGKRLSTFGPISRVNILVGATNSGKSRFMRGLVKSSSHVSFLLDSSVAHPSSILNICERLSRAAKQGEMPGFHLLQRDFLGIRNLLEQELTKPAGGTEHQRRREDLTAFMQKCRSALQTSEGLTEDAIESIKTVLEFIEALPSEPLPRKGTPKVVYIPVLRTAVFLKRISTSDTTDSFAQSISANYGLDSSGAKVEVFTGNLLYWTIKKDLGGRSQIRNRLRNFERFLGKTFFGGKSLELVPLEEDGTGRHLAVWIDEGIQRPFHDIGDGTQAIIILMYRLFTAEPGTWIFIEEPEQGLHPGLQRIFLEALAQDSVLQDRDLTIFISTHSNHLLGMAISELEEDVSVFAFQRRTQPEWTDPEWFQIRSIHTRQPNLLTLLGVANSSVFLANCGIWVEGITDRKYLRAYLSAYLQSDELKKDGYSFVPQEDVHYAFFEYAGSNLVHYLFEAEDDAPSDQAEQIRAQFLCNRIFLLADRDEGKEEKHERLEASQSDSFQYSVTPGIEVENLISRAQLSQALPKLISGLTKEDVDRAKIQFSNYREKHIGLYLKETFGDRCPDTLKAASGTLSAYYKDKLANLVCPNVTWKNMSEDARDLAKALYQFIYKHNQIAPNLRDSKAFGF